MTTLKPDIHSATGRAMVEIYNDDGKMVGCIYSTDNGSNSIHVVSNYFADDEPIKPSIGMLPVPGYLVRFKAKE
ncbi:hypothetical protein KIP88_02500 [Bradyrhizobium sp. SRL28]|uniref:hypothetical protein n=1 Tax=Bradyrhizobium sp. SRL28 TaxID=2836178 RepID=UPI001BDE2B90|nr:hypothetical protein [Bradyrhizobium sp. SRL28]MBT1509360.1 hypothetical protein [Bradyrhizobium sp. SRL28]